MQRLAGDFLVKRTAVIYGASGDTKELYELPNGQWQFGKGRDAQVIRTVEDIAGVEDQSIIRDVTAWLERTKNRPTPEAVQQGMTPLLTGETPKDRLGRAISQMSNEVVNRLLLAIEQTMGPIADSINQGESINHHSAGYGQDQGMHEPATTEQAPFVLPPGAKWADPTRPSSGYLQMIPGADGSPRLDDHGVPMTSWHPTPEFHDLMSHPEPVPVAETVPASGVEREMEEERSRRGASRGRTAGKGRG